MGDRAGEGVTLSGMAVVYRDSGEFERAKECFLAALEIFCQILPEEHLYIEMIRKALAELDEACPSIATYESMKKLLY